MPTIQRKLGWKPDLPDHRDFRFVHTLQDPMALPVKTDLRPLCPAVYDQGQEGSCTANAIGGAFEFEQLKVKKVWDFMPSRNFIYWNERNAEGDVGQDGGAQIRTGMKVINQLGVCTEKLWPYIESKFTVKPSATAYKNAATHKSTLYASVNQDIVSLKSVLASGYPIVFGFSVYSSFMSQQVAQTGIANLPGQNESLEGGHAVLAVGYYDSQQRFIVRNSWGTGWGLKGYFTMPYAYLINPNLACDFWVLKGVSNP